MTSVLVYASWPLLTLAILALWAAAALDILRHKRWGTFTGKGLVGMAALVSVVAAFTISGIFVVFGGQWSEAVSRASTGGVEAGEPAGSGHAYIFSFGLENASFVPPPDATGANQGENGPSHQIRGDRARDE